MFIWRQRTKSEDLSSAMPDRSHGKRTLIRTQVVDVDLFAAGASYDRGLEARDARGGVGKRGPEGATPLKRHEYHPVRVGLADAAVAPARRDERVLDLHDEELAREHVVGGALDAHNATRLETRAGASAIKAHAHPLKLLEARTGAGSGNLGREHTRRVLVPLARAVAGCAHDGDVG